jgi:hypothetical protein
MTEDANDKYFWVQAPCERGHIFVWTSDSTIVNMKIPKGTVCQCGKFISDGKGDMEEVTR